MGVNWTAEIMPLKFLGSTGSGSTSNAIRAVDYAVANGAKLSNNSWGGGGYSQALYDAINRANGQGSLFVAAAGNGGSDSVGDNNDTTPHYPSSYDLNNTIAVASTTRTDERSGFSNYGPKSVDLAAPGSSVYSTLPGNAYGSKSGTSMATPHVSGALSLLLSKEPTLSHTQAKERLLSNVDKPNINGSNPLAGKVASEGRMNASRLVGGETPDVSPRTVTATSPTSGASGVARKTSVTATFSEAISPVSLTASTFTLVKDGTTTPVSATVTLSSDGKMATMTPTNNTSLNSRTTYRATVKGGTDGVKDLKENALASNKSWTFKTAR